MDYHLSRVWAMTILVVAIWEMVWKGLALWRAARRNESSWFIVLVVLNTVGLLPIYYLLTHKDQVADKK